MLTCLVECPFCSYCQHLLVTIETKMGITVQNRSIFNGKSIPQKLKQKYLIYFCLMQRIFYKNKKNK